MFTRINILLCLLLAMGVTVGIVLTTTQPPGTHAVPHAKFDAMLHGGPEIVPSRVEMLGWLFGILQIAVYVVCMTLSIARRSDGPRGGRRVLYVSFTAGTLLYAGVFTQLVLSDRAAAQSGVVSFLGPFPAATTWMLFGLWAAPLLFVAAYLYGFSRWIISDEGLARFEELVSRQQKGPDTTL